MRWTFCLILVGAALLPWSLARSGPTVPAAAHAVMPYGRLDRRWLVLSPSAGIRVSVDGGQTWLQPAGLPGRGSFYSLTADPDAPGVAYAVNGDLFGTRDGGLTWRRIPPPAGHIGPGGLTSVACAARCEAVLAAASNVQAYVAARARWQVWGRDWPQDSPPVGLAPLSGGGLFAATPARLYYLSGPRARWQPVAGGDAAVGRITAVAVAPDGHSAVVAIRGRGLWLAGPTGAWRRAGNNLPADAIVSQITDDPGNADIYAATNRGLFVHDQSAGPRLGRAGDWRSAVPAHGDAIITVQAAGGGLIAVTAHGVVYRGTRGRWQSLTWPAVPLATLRGVSPLLEAVSGLSWQARPGMTGVPEQFARRCLPVGPALGQTFDVCGPFRDFFILFGYPVLGWPRDRAAPDAPGVVRQVFDNVDLEWSRNKGVYLAPIGRLSAGGQVFPHPTSRALSQNLTAVINGYYVDPIFYPFWRAHQFHDVSIFGPPISQVIVRPSTDGTGLPVKVQYFVNARLEYHAAGIPVRVSSLND